VPASVGVVEGMSLGLSEGRRVGAPMSDKGSKVGIVVAGLLVEGGVGVVSRVGTGDGCMTRVGAGEAVGSVSAGVGGDVAEVGERIVGSGDG
jgi:hypothetical protein